MKTPIAELFVSVAGTKPLSRNEVLVIEAFEKLGAKLSAHTDIPKSEGSVSQSEVAAAYKTINLADPDTGTQVTRLRKLYKQVGEDPAVGDHAILQILESGPGAAARLAGTADAVVRLHGLKEE